MPTCNDLFSSALAVLGALDDAWQVEQLQDRQTGSVALKLERHLELEERNRAGLT